MGIERFEANANLPLSAFQSPQSILNWSASIPHPAFDMKEVSAVSNKQFRTSMYLKKRPSPHGVSKIHKCTPTIRPPLGIQKSPHSARAALMQQRQRDAHISAIRKETQLWEDDYRSEIRHYMEEMEKQTMPHVASMDQQPEIRWHMRPCLVDFLVEVHFNFRLRPETLYLALNIVDRYVSRRIVYIKHYQLVGCAALWIAAKFEDAKERVPSVHDLVSICRETYDESAFIQMEGHLLSTIQWQLGHPTAEAWLRMFCGGHTPEDQKVQHVARFLMEITLFHREFVKFPPSAIASGALTLARFMCGKGRRLTDVTEESLDVAEELDCRLAEYSNQLSQILMKKYAYAFYGKASHFVVEYYLSGGRFNPRPYAAIPMTPARSPASSVSTPTSVSTNTSDWSDDGPLTPSTPPITTDPFLVTVTDEDKENLPALSTLSTGPTTYEPPSAIVKQKAESPPDSSLSPDLVTCGRPALHSLNVSSPLAVS